MFRRSLKKIAALSRLAKRRAAPLGRPCVQERSLHLEPLELRTLLTATLYVDFGDRFAGGVLNTTVGALDSTAFGTNPNIDGPELSALGYSAGQSVEITSFNTIFGAAAASMRSTIMQLVTRFYEPFDITVAELTSTLTDVNGYLVQAASSLNDISATLGVNEGGGKDNDTYVIVGQFIVGGTDNLSNFIGGISPGADLSNFNTHDGTPIVCVDGGEPSGWIGDTIAHEAGHAFGLRHVYRTGGPQYSAAYDTLHRSEIMSYLPTRVYQMFSRWPTMAAENAAFTAYNTDPNFLSITVAGALTPYDQFRIDPYIGLRTNYEYVTGTGAHDVIFISGAGATATVTLTPYSAAGRTGNINMPGTATGNTYTYTITLGPNVTIDAGDGNDLIVLAGDLGSATFNVRGMADTDLLYIGSGAEVTYRPRTSVPFGIDFNPDYGGTIQVGAATVNFREFESGSIVYVSGASKVTYATLGSGGIGDAVTLSTTRVNDPYTRVSTPFDTVSANSGGDTPVALYVTAISDLVINTAANDSATTGSDSVNITGDLGAIGTLNLSVQLGAGADGVSFAGAWTAFSQIVTLTVDDTARTAANTYTFNSATTNNIQRNGTATANYIAITRFSSITVLGGSANDTFSLTMVATMPTTTLTFSGGGGTDAMALTDYAGAPLRNVTFTYVSPLVSVTGLGTGFNVRAGSGTESLTWNGNVTRDDLVTFVGTSAADAFTAQATGANSATVTLAGGWAASVTVGNVFAGDRSTRFGVLIDGAAPTVAPGDSLTYSTGAVTATGSLIYTGTNRGYITRAGFADVYFQSIETVNLPIYLTVATTFTINEGQSVPLTFTATSFDPNYPVAQFQWLYGSTVIAGAATITIPWSTLVSYGINNGTWDYTITAKATNVSGYFVTKTATLRVNDLAPTVRIGGLTSWNENQLYTLNLSSVDPGDVPAFGYQCDPITSWVIDWGDGQIQTITGNPSSVTHLYILGTGTLIGSGTERHTLRATAIDSSTIPVVNRNTLSNTLILTINDTAPVISPIVVPPVIYSIPEQELTYSATFIDGGTHTVTWDWGDGTQNVIPAVETDPYNRSTSATHTYQFPGNFTITLTILDTNPNNRGLSSFVTTVAVMNPAGVGPDPINPTTAQALYVFGSSANDSLLVGTVGSTTTLSVAINGKIFGTYSTPFGHIIIYGQGGNDTMQVSNSITTPAWLFGGDGNDYLVGSAGRNLLVGGAGLDRLSGGVNDDLIIGGSTSLLVARYSLDKTALAAIMSEWEQNIAASTRIAHLSGTAGGLNGTTFLYGKPAGVLQNVFDDAARDTIIGGPGYDLFFASLTGDSFISRTAYQTTIDT